ncbi:MAG: 50S ribosomal protein L25 [Micavibrio aeruginosavorus]|uniref:Large ribosomal subunit protein bL25 n=1 Tax=Micavibrio aeruginosavorus TaxID=349221 RepID=A0A2W5FHD0_9BACT|nr:MAG: 50S ribosomal protein L25 [Micavibrio aeruginosavorus]
MSSKRYALAAQKRERAGKGIARQLRRENRVPAVIYGDNKAPVIISLPEKETRLEYHKGHIFTNLCEIDLEGEKILALVRDVQLHPVSDKIESVDFLRVGPKTKTTVHVPVHFTGYETSPAGKSGGVLNVAYHELELRCVVTDIPEAVEIDLSSANIGDSVHMADVKLPKGAESPSKENITIASIVSPKEFVEAEITAPESDAEVAAKAAAAAGKDGKPAAKPAAKK